MSVPIGGWKRSNGALLLFIIVGVIGFVNGLHLRTVKPSSLEKPFLPILLMHGIFSDNNTLSELRQYIEDMVPKGTIVYSVPSKGLVTSVLGSMEGQLDDFKKQIALTKRQFNITDHHLVCHSQGGLLCRSYIQTTPDHNVKVFISLSGVQNGEFGVPSAGPWEDYMLKYLPFLTHTALDDIYKIFYSKIGQESVSFAGYWKDPYQMSLYKLSSQFLAVMNNDSSVDYANLFKFKENMLKIDKMILTGSPKDEVIIPYQSAHFDYYLMNPTTQKLEILPMSEQSVYIKDVFGLKTLDNEKRLLRLTSPDATHLDWIFRRNLVEKYVIPYLY